jgi:hypothetical protein
MPQLVADACKTAAAWVSCGVGPGLTLACAISEQRCQGVRGGSPNQIDSAVADNCHGRLIPKNHFALTVGIPMQKG